MVLRVSLSVFLSSIYSTPPSQVLDRFFPHPVRYHQVWSQERGQRAFFSWEAVPPEGPFIALGMIGTDDREPPPLEAMRCVHASWLGAWNTLLNIMGYFGRIYTFHPSQLQTDTHCFSLYYKPISSLSSPHQNLASPHLGRQWDGGAAREHMGDQRVASIGRYRYAPTLSL